MSHPRHGIWQLSVRIPIMVYSSCLLTYRHGIWQLCADIPIMIYDSCLLTSLYIETEMSSFDFTTVYQWMTRAVYIVLYPPDLKSSGQPRVLFMLSTTRRLLKVSEIPCDDGDVLSGEFFQLSSCRRLCTCVDWHTWTRLCANDCRSCVSLTCNGGELAWGSGYEYVVVLLLFFDTQLPLIALILPYDSCRIVRCM